MKEIEQWARKNCSRQREYCEQKHRYGKVQSVYQKKISSREHKRKRKFFLRNKTSILNHRDQI